jgi:hypothetical protein
MANQGNTNLITTGPELADVDIVNYYSQVKSDTNYSEIILQKEDTIYVSESEVQAALNYRDVFKQGDVISPLNNLSNTLQQKKFNDTTFSFDTIVYWFQKLKYSNKELISLNNQGSTFGEKILPQLNPAVSKDLKNGFFSGFNLQQSIFNSDAITSIGKLLGGTQSTLGPLATLADTTPTPQSFFDNVSDSIGTLANSKYLQLDSTLPIFDISQEYYGVPIPYSASTESKISNNTRNIAYNLSRGTTALMRRNLLNVAYTVPANAQNMASDATVAHGLNLINDLPTFTKINTALPTLVSNLALKYTAIPRVFQFIQYLCNIGNQTAANLRDIFPVQPSDRDFIVVSSAERALASNAERKQISDNAITQSYLQQQGVNYSGTYGNNVGGQFSGTLTAAPYVAKINPEGQSVSSKLNQQLISSGIDATTYVDKNGVTRVDRASYAALIGARLEGSPLIGYVPADGASYGITTGSKEEWTNFMMRLGENESGFNVNSSNSADPGGSVGIQQIGARQAVVYGGFTPTTTIRDGNNNLPSLTPSEAANVKVNTATAVSIAEQLIVPASGGAGIIGGGNYGRQGIARTYALTTLNKSRTG